MIDQNVIFYDGEMEITVKVSSVIHFNTLEEYARETPVEWYAPHLSTVNEALEAYRSIVDERDGSRPYTDEAVKESGGMNAILFRLA
jgi:ASC-1-like (ASCH) protein